MTAPRSTTSSDDTPRKIDLSLTQVAAAALAAVTAAVLGSRVGAAGTLVGAALASVTLNVGTAVYRASLERSQRRVRSLVQHRLPWPTFREGSRAGQPQVADAPPGAEPTTGPDAEPKAREKSRWFTRLRWGAVVVGAVVGFVLAMMVVTGFEWARGETLGGNGQGTTIGQVVPGPPVGPQGPAVPTEPSPSETPPSETPTETTTPSTETTTTPDGGTEDEGAQNPSETSDPLAPTEERPSPPLIPTRLPGSGG